MPVVRDGERIVWLAGVRMSEEYRVSAETGTAMRLTWSDRQEPIAVEADGTRNGDG